MPYQVTPTALEGVLVLEPKVFGDARGFFFESFNQRDFQQATGVRADFVQDNHSKSSQGVLRGLHYQVQHAQGKLVRVVHGISDVGEIDVLFQGHTEPVFDNVNLTTEAGYEAVDARTVTLIVRAEGSGRQLVKLVKKEMRLQPGHSYTVVLTGSGSQRIEAIVVDDRAVPATDADDTTTDSTRGETR